MITAKRKEHYWKTHSSHYLRQLCNVLCQYINEKLSDAIFHHLKYFGKRIEWEKNKDLYKVNKDLSHVVNQGKKHMGKWQRDQLNLCFI